MITSKTGITVKQIKEYVKDLPETDPSTGEEYEVWYAENGLSNPVKTIMQLNKGDIILSIDKNE